MAVQFNHIPVMLTNVPEALEVENPKIYLDLTAGGGGHAEAICLKYPKIKAILIDRDTDAVEHLKEKFAGRSNIIVANARSGEIDKIMFLLKERKADIILADLGVSSFQFDSADRGFSFSDDGPMDMRMNKTEGMTALDLIMNSTEQELQQILSTLGEEREAKTVAKALKKAAEEGAVTTKAFSDAITTAKRFKKGRISPATQAFMALRMAVNDELGELSRMLEKGYNILAAGGKMGFITFHSGEDRVVKRFFQEKQQSGAVKVFRFQEPGDDEKSANARARSAKLRVLQKL